jgi:glyoxylase-like metal-dependent hydrolase (beta-lactamase superfamily II)
MWMHPDHQHGFSPATDPEAAVARRVEIGRQSGVPEAALARYAERARDLPSGIARVIEPDRALVDGVTIETDLGVWSVVETPGHAPSHVCLFQAERRLVISGDHLLGRISQYFDYGWTPDPIGEFLSSLDRVGRLDARLALSGHGKPFIDIPGHSEGNRRLIRERLDAVLAAVSERPRTALEVAPSVHGEPISETRVGWVLQETLCYLRHLELSGRVERLSEDGIERWTGELSDSRTKP